MTTPGERDTVPALARAARDSWFTTAAAAALAAALLLYASHGILTGLLGIAGLTSLAAGVAAAFYAPRRARDIRTAVATGRPPPSSRHAMTVLATLTTTTAILTAAAELIRK